MRKYLVVCYTRNDGLTICAAYSGGETGWMTMNEARDLCFYYKERFPRNKYFVMAQVGEAVEVKEPRFELQSS